MILEVKMEDFIENCDMENFRKILKSFDKMNEGNIEFWNQMEKIILNQFESILDDNMIVL